jgi:hypothetical protein
VRGAEEHKQLDRQCAGARVNGLFAETGVQPNSKATLPVLTRIKKLHQIATGFDQVSQSGRMGRHSMRALRKVMQL